MLSTVISGSFSFVMTKSRWEALWPDPAAVLNAVGLIPGAEAIDLCSGDGWFTLHIARAARHVVAIDIDCDMLDAARRRLRQNGISNCDFVAGDAYEVRKLAPCPADFVFMANAFHGVPDRPFIRANLCGANLWKANLSKAILYGADLTYVTLVDTNLTDADLAGCHIYGLSAWALKLQGAKQAAA